MESIFQKVEKSLMACFQTGKTMPAAQCCHHFLLTSSTIAFKMTSKDVDITRAMVALREFLVIFDLTVGCLGFTILL